MTGRMEVLVYCGLILGLICPCHSLDNGNSLNRFKRSQESMWSDPSDCTARRTKQTVVPMNSHNFSLDILMPGVVPTGSDSYLCMAIPVPTVQDFYIVDFVPHASMDTAHHMLLYGCQSPVSTSGYWDCGSVQGTCEEEASIMYAWARNAPPTKLPKDVGFKVGGNSGISYFVLQIHYGDVGAFRDHHRDCSGITLRMTSKRQPFIAGIYLLVAVDVVIPPGNRVTNADVACDFESYPIFPFAFRTHTHHLGKVVSGYRIRDDKWTLIGRQSPQLPQAFYAANRDVDVKYGDTLAARCVFTGEGRTSKTYIGGTSSDEMCNFYIMYYMENKHAVPFMNCMETGSTELFQNIPYEANVPIPVNTDTMFSMMHVGHATDPWNNKASSQPNKVEQETLNQGDLYSLLSKLVGESQDLRKYDPSRTQAAQSELLAHIDNVMQRKKGSGSRLSFPAREEAILVRDRVHKFHQIEAPATPPGRKLPPVAVLGTESKAYHLEESTAWPGRELQLGQVAGLALDSDGNLLIFHRGDHRWGVNSFDLKARYQQRSLGPIQQSTILVVDPVKGHILKALGRNMFYMPHGITTDSDNNYWVTDVALHQVLKLSSSARGKPLVVLGEAFTPGSDSNHFCQPTDVAVDTTTGNIYISDGYCNARILEFSPDGKYLSEWGAGSLDRRRWVPFGIPHSLTYLPDRRELCVADRENGRIQCFVANSGEFIKEISREEFGGEVYAISSSFANGGLIYAVNGNSPIGYSAPPKGFVIDYSSKDIVDVFNPVQQEFEMPHDLVVSKDGSVFVADAGSSSVFKFTSEKSLHRSVKKAGIEVRELEEIESMVQTKLKPLHKVLLEAAAATQQKAAPDPEKLPNSPQTQAHHQQQQLEEEAEKRKTMGKMANQSAHQGVTSSALITSLLLVPLVLVISIAAFIRCRKTRVYEDGFEVKPNTNSAGGILGKLKGKATGSLNLGNFLATNKGYTRQGFDRLSTEGSDQEKEDDNTTDSENEEFSAPPPATVSSP